MKGLTFTLIPTTGRFPPEFTKPKTLRGSQMQAPWEWKPNPVAQQLVAEQLQRTTLQRQQQQQQLPGAMLAASAQTLQRLGTAQAGGRAAAMELRA